MNKVQKLILEAITEDGEVVRNEIPRYEGASTMVLYRADKWVIVKVPDAALDLGPAEFARACIADARDGLFTSGANVA